MATTVERFGRLDGVAAIAGQGIHGRALDLSIAQWESEVMGKLRGVLDLVAPARPHLRRSDGPRIVTLSAPTARDPDPGMAAISTGRAAVASLSRALALDLAGAGISVNAVAVGLIDTPRQHRRHHDVAPNIPYDDWLRGEADERRVPMRRPGSVADVALLVTLALSPALGFTTGSVLDATGGLPGS